MSTTYRESEHRAREYEAAVRFNAAVERAERTGRHEDYLALNIAHRAWKESRSWRTRRSGGEEG